MGQYCVVYYFVSKTNYKLLLFSKKRFKAIHKLNVNVVVYFLDSYKKLPYLLFVHF